MPVEKVSLESAVMPTLRPLSSMMPLIPLSNARSPVHQPCAVTVTTPGLA